MHTNTQTHAQIQTQTHRQTRTWMGVLFLQLPRAVYHIQVLRRACLCSDVSSCHCCSTVVTGSLSSFWCLPRRDAAVRGGQSAVAFGVPLVSPPNVAMLLFEAVISTWDPDTGTFDLSPGYYEVKDPVLLILSLERRQPSRRAFHSNNNLKSGSILGE